MTESLMISAPRALIAPPDCSPYSEMPPFSLIRFSVRLPISSIARSPLIDGSIVALPAPGWTIVVMLPRPVITPTSRSPFSSSGTSFGSRFSL